MNKADNALVTRLARAFGQPINQTKKRWERLLPEEREEWREVLRQADHKLHMNARVELVGEEDEQC